MMAGFAKASNLVRSLEPSVHAVSAVNVGKRRELSTMLISSTSMGGIGMTGSVAMAGMSLELYAFTVVEDDVEYDNCYLAMTIPGWPKTHNDVESRDQHGELEQASLGCAEQLTRRDARSSFSIPQQSFIEHDTHISLWRTSYLDHSTPGVLSDVLCGCLVQCATSHRIRI